MRVSTFLCSVMGDTARLPPSRTDCREGTTEPGRHGWLCDGAHTHAAARRLCLCRRLLGVVAAQQAPDQGSPASPRSSTPPHRRAFSHMAVVRPRRQTPPPRQRLLSRGAGVLPGTSANVLTSMPFAPRCTDVSRGWHSACTGSRGEPGGMGDAADAALRACERARGSYHTRCSRC